MIDSKAARPDGNCDQKTTTPGPGDKDLALLRTAVKAASELAMRYFRADPEHWTKGPGQIVTEADIAIDRQLHDLLIGARPEDGWLSEERPDDGSRLEKRRVWIVDPIDGTRSFAAGSPEFVISIALVIDGRPALGAIANPVTEENFEAVLGAGARLNAKGLIPSNHGDTAAADLLASASEMRRRDWPSLIPEARFTTIGSLAYKLALIAAGRYDGLISLRSCHDWDIAAAALLLSETGARLSDAEGRPITLNSGTLRHHGLVAAGRKSLYDQLLATLEGAARA
jgi:myo-inositol-1(or 4)-monophosphatase